MASVALGNQQQERALSVGRVFARSIDVIRANPVATLGTSFVLTALPSMLIGMTGYSATMLSGVSRANFGAAVAASALVVIILWLVAYGALLQAAVTHGEGRKAELGKMLRTGITRFLPLFAVYLIYWLAISLGFTLLIVPGLILAVMWSLATVAVVVERPGVFGAFARSRALTKGARWKILGTLLVALILYMLVVGTIGIVTVAGNGTLPALSGTTTVAPPSIGGQLISTLVNTVMITWLTVFGGALFVEVRDWKDGPGTERLADIFA